jgi:hypothetical protein
MRILFTFSFALTLACMVMLGTGVARAQQQGQDQSQDQSQNPSQTPSQGQGQQQNPSDQGPTQPQGPIPAYRSPLAGAADNEDEDENPTEITPDNRAVTGVLPFGLGMLNEHSYWQPHVNVAFTADSNPSETTGGTSWGSWTSISGGVDAHHVSQNNDLELSYVGGAQFLSSGGTDGAGNGAVQALSFLDRVTFHRWALSLVDGLSYLPESSFGYGGLGAGSVGGVPGGGLPGVGQTLLVGEGQNLANSFNAEADVFLSGRTSLTFAGGYSTLNYFDSDLLDYGSAIARIGYNYLIDRKNTIGLDYTFGETNYSNFHQSIIEHTVQGVYGRRVTGKLAFQVAAGAEVASFQVPITTPAEGGTGSPTPSGPTTSVYWTLNTNLSYAMQRTSFGLAYFHGVSGGSGVFAGSVQDNVSGSVTRRMTRLFSSGIIGGYSRNRGLAVVDTTTPFTTQTFDYWYGGGNFSYPIGRTMAVSFSYQLQYQTSGTAFCIGTPCGTDVIRHMISMGLNWRDRQRRF